MPIWTPAALSSEARPLQGRCWRLVEAQHRVSTLKLVDSLAEQALLEELLETTKPPVPPECRHLHYLLATPFRYGAYPKGSRFRRAGLTPGVYYASEAPETAVAEIAFYRLLFFAESPATPWPVNAAEFTAFAVPFAAGLYAAVSRRINREAYLVTEIHASELLESLRTQTEEHDRTQVPPTVAGGARRRGGGRRRRSSGTPDAAPLNHADPAPSA